MPLDHINECLNVVVLKPVVIVQKHHHVFRDDIRSHGVDMATGVHVGTRVVWQANDDRIRAHLALVNHLSSRLLILWAVNKDVMSGLPSLFVNALNGLFKAWSTNGAGYHCGG
jgi:hypothetical protein